MLKFKAGAVDSKEEEGGLPVDRDGAEMFWEFYKENVLDKATGWRKTCDVGGPKDNYVGTIYQKDAPFPGTAIDLIKTDCYFKGVSKEDWFEAFKDGPPISNLKSKEVVEEISPTERIICLRTSLPIMTDRE